VRLTGRGAVVGMTVLFVIGLLASSSVGGDVLAGLTFAVGATVAARYTTPADLLVVAVAPPAVFAVVLFGVKAASAPGSLLSLLTAWLLALATAAPWLIAGMAASLLIAWRRGLPRSAGRLWRDKPPAGVSADHHAGASHPQ
jgi:hypothetical protein